MAHGAAIFDVNLGNAVSSYKPRFDEFRDTWIVDELARFWRCMAV
jgi:hypothetical protein